MSIEMECETCGGLCEVTDDGMVCIEGRHAEELLETIARLTTARPIGEWTDKCGAVLWWTFPISGRPWCGRPVDPDWPGGHTHWTPLPAPKRA
jgi:hypothetical protein